MLEFVCFVLEGLKDHGHKQIWQRIGSFATRAAALKAAEGESGLVSSHIAPLYRAPLAFAYPQPSSAVVRDGKSAPRFAEISI